jgi:hypothetical protein
MKRHFFTHFPSKEAYFSFLKSEIADIYQASISFIRKFLRFFVVKEKSINNIIL